MSLRASAASPCRTSGAMYWKVPTMEPFCVSGEAAEVSEAKLMVGVEGVRPLAPVMAISGFARPKSINLAPDLVSMMLAGFRSRWMMPWRWAFSRAEAISMPTVRTWASGSAPFSRRSARVCPSSSSITRKSTPSCEPTSKSVQILGCWRAEIALDSRSRRCLRPGSDERCAGRTLMATLRSRRVSRAR